MWMVTKQCVVFERVTVFIFVKLWLVSFFCENCMNYGWWYDEGLVWGLYLAVAESSTTSVHLWFVYSTPQGYMLFPWRNSCVIPYVNRPCFMLQITLDVNCCLFYFLYYVWGKVIGKIFWHLKTIFCYLSLPTWQYMLRRENPDVAIGWIRGWACGDLSTRTACATELLVGENHGQCWCWTQWQLQTSK